MVLSLFLLCHKTDAWLFSFYSVNIFRLAPRVMDSDNCISRARVDIVFAIETSSEYVSLENLTGAPCN